MRWCVCAWKCGFDGRGGKNGRGEWRLVQPIEKYFIPRNTQLEGSKAFAKDFLARNIPTAFMRCLRRWMQPFRHVRERLPS